MLALVVRKLARDVEADANDRITIATIDVPAGLQAGQGDAVLRSCALANVSRPRVVQQCLAAIAYYKRNDLSGHVLICD